MGLVTDIRFWAEKNGFNVLSRLADKMGIRARSVRTSFIYVTFATLGVGFFIYVVLAFWFRIKDLVYQKRSSVFDL